MQILFLKQLKNLTCSIKTEVNMNTKKVFFHVDIDAFYASVEQLDNPEYKGLPVIVGGNSRRSVVSTCSYEARKFGVHSAMPIMKARQLCPSGIFIKVRMDRYHQKSKEVMKVFNDFSPNVQQISIDEAFLEMTGMEKLLGLPENSAKLLKETVYRKTGLNISIGCASNKYIAKIASAKSKPNGLLIVPAGTEAEFMKKLSLKDVWGIGKKTREKLIVSGLSDISKILEASEYLLKTILGEAAGKFLYNAVRGKLTEIFSEDVKHHSISTEETFETDLFSHEEIDDVLFYLSNELMYRILDEKIHSKTVAVKIRYNDFKTVSIQSSESVINDSQDLYNRARVLFYKKFDNKTPIRLLGISVSKTETDDTKLQTELFVSEKDTKKRKIAEAMYNLTKKEGKNILKPARLLKDESANSPQSSRIRDF